MSMFNNGEVVRDLPIVKYSGGKDHLTHWKKLHNPDYIGAYAFEPEQEIVATIKTAGVENVTGPNGKAEQCMVVRFEEPGIKPMICNVTNSKTISKVTGSPYIENWTGKQIQMFVATVNAFGEEVEAVRIRPRAPKTTLPDLTPDHPKWPSAAEKFKAGETTLDVIRKHFTLSPENEELIKNA